MTIPDSLQTFGGDVFYECFNLVLSHVDIGDVNEVDNDVTADVVHHLRTQQRIAALEKENAAQATEIAVLGARIAQLEIALPTPPSNNFISTIDFKRHFVGFVHVEMLLVLREVCKEWNDVVIEHVDESVESGATIVHGGKGVDNDVAEALEERQGLITQVIFLLNVTKVGENACYCAINLVVVDIPKGVVSIGSHAFNSCVSLTTVSFPTTLTSIEKAAFNRCSSLDNIDLLHTNLQELGGHAFAWCSELKSMTIPDSLQELGDDIFWGCYKLVPSNIDLSGYPDATSEVVAHLRSLQN